MKKFKCYNNVIKVISEDKKSIKVLSLLLSDNSVKIDELLNFITPDLIMILKNSYINDNDNQSLFVLFKLFTNESFFKSSLSTKEYQDILNDKKFIQKLTESTKDEKYYIFSLIVLKLLSILPETRELLFDKDIIILLISSITKENEKNINEIFNILEIDPLTGKSNEKYYELIQLKESIIAIKKYPLKSPFIKNILLPLLKHYGKDILELNLIKNLIESIENDKENGNTLFIIDIIRLYLKEINEIEIYKEMLKKYNLIDIITKIIDCNENFQTFKNDLIL